MRLEAAKLLNTAAPAYEAAGNHTRAVQVLHTAASRLGAALASDPDNEDTQLHLGWVWCNLGEVYRHGAAWKDAEGCYRRSLEALSKLTGRGRLDLDIDPGRMAAVAERGLTECRKRE